MNSLLGVLAFVASRGRKSVARAAGPVELSTGGVILCRLSSVVWRRRACASGCIDSSQLRSVLGDHGTTIGAHRIRLQISASFTPNFSHNLQSAKSEVNSVEMKRAHIRVFHDAKHLSQVVLPILPIVK